MVGATGPRIKPQPDMTLMAYRMNRRPSADVAALCCATRCTEAGTDVLRFNGSAGSEIFQLSANGTRTQLTRNLGNIVMDLDGLEQVDLRALGGTDTAIINDLSATGVTEVNIDLAGTLAGTMGDAAADVVIVNGTNGNDIIDVFGAGAFFNSAAFPEFFQELLLIPHADRRSVRALAFGREGATLSVTSQFDLIRKDDEQFQPGGVIQGLDGAIYVFNRPVGENSARPTADSPKVLRLSWAGHGDSPAAIGRQEIRPFAKDD